MKVSIENTETNTAQGSSATQSTVGGQALGVYGDEDIPRRPIQSLKGILGAVPEGITLSDLENGIGEGATFRHKL